MAPRDMNKEAAESVVRDSLGLSADDLGMYPGEDSFSQDLEGDPGDDDGAHDDLGQDQFSHEAQFEDDLSDKFQPQEPTPAPKQQQQQQQQQQQPLPKNAEVRVDGKGNLVDRKTGQVVARAGAEARMYQKLHKTTQAYAGLQTQYNDTEARLQKAVEIGTQMFDKLKQLQNDQSEVAPQRYGLSNAEAVEAMNFAKEAKVNPVATIQKLLTKAASNGIDLSSIGLSGGNFDPKSLLDIVRGEINSAMNPLKERSQRETAKEQQEREASENATAASNELKSFLAQNPEAKEHLPVFQRIYNTPELQHMSLGEVWARLQLNLMKRQQQQPASNQRPANQRQQRKPLPNGRRMPPNQGRPSELAPVDMSYDDILRGILT